MSRNIVMGTGRISKLREYARGFGNDTDGVPVKRSELIDLLNLAEEFIRAATEPETKAKACSNCADPEDNDRVVCISSACVCACHDGRRCAP